MTRVHILATGGTIAGTASSGVDAAYRAGGLSLDALLDGVPGLGELATLTGEQLAQVGSQDMTDVLWLQLAERVNALFSADEADGIVITHGTDTAEETGYFLHLVVKSARPVVLTGSMRPATALSADGPLNLFNAVRCCRRPGRSRQRRHHRHQRRPPQRAGRDQIEHHRRADVRLSRSGSARHGELWSHPLFPSSHTPAHDVDGILRRRRGRPASRRHPVRAREHAGRSGASQRFTRSARNRRRGHGKRQCSRRRCARARRRCRGGSRRCPKLQSRQRRCRTQHRGG